MGFKWVYGPLNEYSSSSFFCVLSFVFSLECKETVEDTLWRHSQHIHGCLQTHSALHPAMVHITEITDAMLEFDWSPFSVISV